MEASKHQRGTGTLVEGVAGPFYIALNHATFYLLAGIFVSAAPLIVYLVRNASDPARVVVAFGVAMETGTLVHILLERIRGYPVLLSWIAHALVSAVILALLLFLYFRA